MFTEDCCLVGCVLRPIDNEVIKRQHPHLLSLAKDVKLGFYTVRTPGRRVAVHSATAAQKMIELLSYINILQLI